MVEQYALEEKLAASFPPSSWLDLTVVVGVSGGADSVALLRALAALAGDPAPRNGMARGRLVAAHFNHCLRGAESDEDEQFVVELCRKIGVRCEAGRAGGEGLPRSNGDSLEGAARAARYDFLKATARRLGARYVVTAHTADDQAETILHRILRGTGLAGLSGMARARQLTPEVALVRPLLDVSRVELLQYLQQLRQAFCEDSTNLQLRHTRNRIRRDLLPQLSAQYNTQVADALLRLGALAAEAQEVIDHLVDDLASRAVHFDGDGTVRIDTRGLAQVEPYLVRQLLIHVWKQKQWPQRDMGYPQWTQLSSRARGVAAGVAGPKEVLPVLPGAISAERQQQWLVLRRRRQPPARAISR